MFLVLMDKCIGQQPYYVLFRFPRYFEFQIVIGLASWYTPCVIQLVLYFNNVFYIFKKNNNYCGFIYLLDLSIYKLKILGLML